MEAEGGNWGGGEEKRQKPASYRRVSILSQGPGIWSVASTATLHPLSIPQPLGRRCGALGVTRASLVLEKHRRKAFAQGARG